MSESGTDHDRIHRYLLGQMGEDEISTFEKELKEDAALREATELERNVITLIRLDARAGMKKMLVESETENVIPFTPTRKVRWIPWAGLATVAAVLLLLVINLTTTKEFYEEPPSDLFQGTHRGGASLESDVLKPVREAYLNREYDKALELLAGIKLPEGEVSQNANFIAAHCLWHLKRYPEAAGRFRALRDRTAPEDKLFRYAWWYEVLALRESGDDGKAASELELLHDQQYGNMDADLKKKVDRLMRERH